MNRCILVIINIVIIMVINMVINMVITMVIIFVLIFVILAIMVSFPDPPDFTQHGRRQPSQLWQVPVSSKHNCNAVKIKLLDHCKCRSSDRLHQLVCDHMVWVHLLKQITEFPKERLEELFNFVPEVQRSELMPEVLRAAASKLPSYRPPLQRNPNPMKIVWTLQGRGALETLDIKGSDGYVDHYYKELKNVAKAVRTSFIILEVHWSPALWEDLKMIANHVKVQGQKLGKFELSKIGWRHGPHPHPPHPISNKTFFSLCTMSMNWKVHEVEVGVASDFLLKLDLLAGSSLENGHIGRLTVFKEKERVDLTALKRVWQISDELLICKGFPYRQEPYPRPVQLVKVGGGRGEDQEAVWQTVLDFFLRGNNND